MKKYYYVGENHKKSHVKLCTRDEYAIYYGIKKKNSENKDKVNSTFFDRKMAEEFVIILNGRG